MITVFANFGLEIAPVVCGLVYFDGGDFGGTATFKYCGGRRPTTIEIAPYEFTFSYCVESGSISTSGSVLVAIGGPCDLEP